MTAGTDLTVRGTILGTLQYMAPEQIEGLEADTRTDIFAFGAILYEMVTGAKAFTGKSQSSLMVAILEHDPIPMAALQRITPPALERVVAICLAKAPDDRWQSARDLKLQLDGIAASLLDRGSAPARNRREWMAWSLAAVSTLALLVGGFFYSPTPLSEPPVISTGVRCAASRTGWGTFPRRRGRSLLNDARRRGFLGFPNRNAGVLTRAGLRPDDARVVRSEGADVGASRPDVRDRRCPAFARRKPDRPSAAVAGISCGHLDRGPQSRKQCPSDIRRGERGKTRLVT
jgi:hypothetical protein